MYIVLIVSLILLLFLNTTSFNDFLAPCSLYCLVLLVASIYGLFWFEPWELGDYGISTYLIIMLGAVVFSASGWFVHAVFRDRVDGKTYDEDGIIAASRIKLLVVVAVELVTTILAIQFYGNSLSNLSNAIITYRVASVYGEATMPSYLSFLLNLCMVNGYVSGYIASNNFILSKKVNFIWIIIFAWSVFNSLLAGSRGGAISIVVMFFCFFYIFFKRVNKINNDIRRKRRFRFLIIALVLLAVVFFLRSTRLLGRTMEDSPFYYLAIYLSAPLKNLDINIIRLSEGNQITGTEFHQINGVSLGNVGTVYTYEMIKGGVLAVIGFSFVVGILSSWFYETIRIKELHSNYININFIIYAYLFYSVSMVMFGSTMLDSIFSVFFLKVLACIFVITFFYSIELHGKILTFRRII